MKEKYSFIKTYIGTVKTTEDKEIDKAFEDLSSFYCNLPNRVKSQERRKQWTILINELVNAFAKQAEKIANCPFVKIILSQEEVRKLFISLNEKTSNRR